MTTAAQSLIDLDLPADAEKKVIGIDMAAQGVPDVTGWCVIARSYEVCQAEASRIMDAAQVGSEFCYPYQSAADGLWRVFGFTR